MFQSTVSGIIFVLIAVFLGPALIAAAFQLMSGQKVRLPSLVKPVGKALGTLAAMLWETSGVVANMVADGMPDKYAHLRPFAGPVTRMAIVCLVVWMLGTFLIAMEGR